MDVGLLLLYLGWPTGHKESQRLHLGSGVHAGLRLAVLLKIQRSQAGDWLGMSLELAASWKEGSYRKANSRGRALVWEIFERGVSGRET